MPPRGQLSVVLRGRAERRRRKVADVLQVLRGDQAYRKLVTYETLWQPDTDPLAVVFPAVQAGVEKQTGHPVAIATAAGLDPANYQNFAITNDGVIFFFSQGGLLPEAAGATRCWCRGR